MAGSIPCASCGTAVPPGRLACPACGTLVALAGTGAGASAGAPLEPPPVQPEASPPEPGPVFEGEPAPEPGPAIEPAREPEPVAAPEVQWEPAAPIEQPVQPVAAADLRSADVVPGAYLPPSASPRAGWAPPAAAAPPTWAPPATAAQSAGAPPAGTPPLTVAGRPASPVLPARATAASAAGPAAPGRASILADLPFDAPDQLEGWLVALGAGIGVLAFLLPWRGSYQAGLDGYFDSWGLGIGAHLPVFLLVLAVAVLAVLPNRIASWLRTGVGGMVVGGILLGLVWLYLGGTAEIGAIFGAVGGILMVVGGVIAVGPARTSRTPEDG